IRRATLIASLVLPILGLKKEAATIKVTKRKNANIPDVTHANGANYKRVHLYMDDLAYQTIDYGLEGQLTDHDRENYATDFDAESETVNSIKTKMLLAREKRVKDIVFNTTTFTGAALFTDYSGSPWDTASTDIVAQIGVAKEKVRLGTGVPADSMVIGQAAMENLLKNDDIIARFPGTAVITQAMIEANVAAIFGLQQLLVGQAAYNSADEGQDASMADMWGDDYCLVAALGRAGMPMSEPQLGRTILWENYIPDVAFVEEYREEQTKSDVFRVLENTQEKLFDAPFGHLLQIDA
ncbi:MAG: hypothetical protein KAJ19_09510, partial [Gammaproteobacteria bacterium]|nr:hypothetical protein [Gammaproteobacteria bacterium]